MSTRGITFQFEPGEYVLCFEPDPTKAKVLYDAKILEQAAARDSKGRKRADYLIHFQGWNNSWDRFVPESFVLKNSDDNRRLMQRLADTVRIIKKNKARKRRIENILKMHFGDQRRFDSSDSEDDDDDEENDDDSSGSDDEDEDEDGVEEEEGSSDDEGRVTIKQEPDEDNHHHAQNGAGSDEDSEEEEEEDLTDGLDIVAGEVDLPLPNNLKSILEDDCYFITRKDKLVEVPADPNVITILEGYVKNFAINVLCATVDKLRPRDTYPPPPEKNIDLCKEVMDGLRVIFDFTLPTNLLYGPERDQYEKLSKSFKPISSAKKEEEDPIQKALNSPLVHSPRLRSSGIKREPGSPGAASGEPYAKIPQLSPKNLMKREQEEARKGRDDLSEDEMPGRRMTRHSYQEEIRRIRPGSGHGSGQSSSATKAPQNGVMSYSERKAAGSSGDGTRRRESLRSSLRHNPELAVAASSASSNKSSLSDRVTPPPPLLIPNAIHSQTSSRCSTPTLPDGALSDREGALNSVLSWKLISDDKYYEETPTPPSVLYGAHHLLRLFVKLPDILSQMPINDSKLKPLEKHLSLFIEYLSDRIEDLFPDVYMEADDFSTPNNKPTARR